MIEWKNIRKSFGDKEVLKGISGLFETGCTNLIIGESGSGKTVLLKCLVGLLTPDEGDIRYDGRSLFAMDKFTKTRLRMEMGMLFQGSALFDSMTLLENVLFPLQLFSGMNKSDQRKRARYCLHRVGWPIMNGCFLLNSVEGCRKGRLLPGLLR
jgi:phospholipid/cholesterol/gamma-HCH transport system ATP-binding protein